MARSALVAMAAGIVIVGLSGAAKQSDEPIVMSSAKGDRLAQSSTVVARADVVAQTSAENGAVLRRDSAGDVVYLNDPGTRTTTVARGATVPLSPQSPLAGSAQ